MKFIKRGEKGVLGYPLYREFEEKLRRCHSGLDSVRGSTVADILTLIGRGGY